MAWAATAGGGGDRPEAGQGGPTPPANGTPGASDELGGHPPGRTPAAGGAHADAEGVRLVAADHESVSGGASCAADAPRRRYDVAALAVDITLNRYLDHDPEGRMFALASQVGAVRAEEAANAAARRRGAAPAVSVGMQGDAIQPLTLRVLPGECLVISLDNRLDEPASLHLHGSSLRITETGAPAIAADPRATAPPGGTVTYEWAVPPDEPEGTHYFHSHGVERDQTSHGLFGALVVEPAGSRWLDPLTGEPTETGWQAVILPPQGPAFREFALYYHEIGHENYRLRDREDLLVPVVDPITSAYRPGARALNYRSEPFMNRLELAREVTGAVDKSLAYSSYAFGDPATPMPRSYVGEPVKQRVVHGGSEVFHVHHVHGGTVRWPRRPGGGAVFGAGLRKSFPEGQSERTDAQSLGPSETFDIEPECASGGCQQGAGDYMYHCHVAHHYFAGMWGLARTYHTLQDGRSSTDTLPPLPPLPGMDDVPPPAVTSDALVGTIAGTPERQREITPSTLAELVEPQLPPAGEPAAGDASVWDWRREGDRYLGEPETEASWPGYAPREPGRRPPLLFHPGTGRLAYPLLRPHLGKRPPFAPGHGPAPYLDPAGHQRDPPPPGVSGPAGLCPAGTRSRELRVTAIRTPVLLNARGRILDPDGMLFVLRERRDDVASDRSLQVPLAVRANVGRDCVDVVLRSELRDDPVTPFSKVGMHIHFVQFDVQGSDGVNAGFNYEQTVRPYAAEGQPLSAPAAAGATLLRVADAARLRPGALVGVGMERDDGFEVARIAAVRRGAIRLEEPLRFPHQAGETVSPEFVRYRWFPDARFGTAYFHDHVDALTTWSHGLFGALVGEPADATWTDPDTGQPLASGPVADVHTTEAAGHEVSGSFRELLLFTQDDNRRTHVRRSTGGTFNLRAEPLRLRAGRPELVFSSDAHGDPETPVLRAHLGDPVVIRDLVGGANEVHTLHVDGHWFRAEPFSPSSKPVAAIDVGISERYDLVIPSAGGPQRKPGDYLYESGRPSKLEEGNWGLLRVLPPGDPALRELSRRTARPGAGGDDVCPPGAPVRRFDVAAVEVPAPMLGRRGGRVFATADAAGEVAAGSRAPEPLVLRVTVGDCVEVALENRLPDARASFRTDLLAADPAASAGVAAGRMPDQSVSPGAVRTYRFHASPEVGEAVAVVRDGADVLGNVSRGMYGAIVVAPAGSTFHDPVDGRELGARSSWRADVRPPDAPPYRDAVLVLHDEDEGIGSHRMPYTEDVDGAVAVNYRSEPLRGRSIAGAVADGPATPVIDAVAGDDVVLHVVAPWSQQVQVFSVEGHRWVEEPSPAGEPAPVGAPRLSSRRVGGLQALTLRLEHGAGGPERLPGDYLYGNHRVPYQEAGAWGVLRVHPRAGDGLRSLGASRGALATAALGAALFAGALLPVALWWRRRRGAASRARRTVEGPRSGG